METGRFICAQRDAEDYIICFTDQTDAEEFRDALGVRDHCKIVGQPASAYPIQLFYLDEEFIHLGSVVLK